MEDLIDKDFSFSSFIKLSREFYRLVKMRRIFTRIGRSAPSSFIIARTFVKIPVASFFSHFRACIRVFNKLIMISRLAYASLTN